jgi:hypothetical protein
MGRWGLAQHPLFGLGRDFGAGGCLLSTAWMVPLRAQLVWYELSSVVGAQGYGRVRLREVARSGSLMGAEGLLVPG